MNKIIAGGSIAVVAGLTTFGFVGTAHAVDENSITFAPIPPSVAGPIDGPDTVVSGPSVAGPTVDTVSTESTAGALPSTGGPNGALLGGGAVLLAAGGAAVVVSRRRQTS